MRIVNDTPSAISYELKGGPLKMTMSTCDLGPGEEEEWTSPYRRQNITVECELYVTAAGETQMVEAGDRDTVRVVAAGEAVELKVERKLF